MEGVMTISRGEGLSEDAFLRARGFFFTAVAVMLLLASVLYVVWNKWPWDG